MSDSSVHTQRVSSQHTVTNTFLGEVMSHNNTVSLLKRLSRSRDSTFVPYSRRSHRSVFTSRTAHQLRGTRHGILWTCLLSAVQCAVSVSVRRYPAREGQVAGSPPGGAPELPRAHRVFTGDAGVGQDKPVPVPVYRCFGKKLAGSFLRILNTTPSS